MKEYASTRVSGLHFGHWKGECTNDYITDVHAIHAAILYMTGYSPKRWQQGIHIMMENSKEIIESQNYELFYYMKQILTIII